MDRQEWFDGLLFVVDNRIFRTPVGVRPYRLRRMDLPVLARAIVAAVREQAVAHVVTQQNIPMVRLLGRGINLTILGEDWEKILPFIQDGTFNPIEVPASPHVGYLDPEVHYDSATLDAADKRLYERVLYTLQGLFQDTYPVSDL